MQYIAKRTNVDSEFLSLLGACQMYSSLIQLELSIYTSGAKGPTSMDPNIFFGAAHSTMGNDKIKSLVRKYYTEEMCILYSRIVKDRNAIMHSIPTNTINEMFYTNKVMDGVRISKSFLIEYSEQCKNFLDLLESRPPNLIPEG